MSEQYFHRPEGGGWPESYHLLDVSKKSFWRGAQRHGYDMVVGCPANAKEKGQLAQTSDSVFEDFTDDYGGTYTRVEESQIPELVLKRLHKTKKGLEKYRKEMGFL